MTLETALHRFRLAWQQPASNDEIRPASHDLARKAEAAQRRIATLEHWLRSASERFTWLGEHHVSSEYARKECKILADQMWSAQAPPVSEWKRL